MDVETLAWLQTAEGQRLLDEAARVRDPLRDGARLRRSHDAARVAAALGQIELRQRAREKFGDWAGRLYLTRDGLEQATRRTIARHRAQRLAHALPDLPHSTGRVLDLGCGLGGDLLALAESGLQVLGIDDDPLRVALARANLTAVGLEGKVRLADATTVDRNEADASVADPARRSGAGRTFRVEDWVPPWSFVQEVLGGPACVKVAPGIPHSLVPAGVEAEWVSDSGDLKEAALWSPPFAGARRRATVLGRHGQASVTDADLADVGAGRPLAYLYEPDDAITRAGLVTAVAASVDGRLLDEHHSWVTSEEHRPTRLARCYRVLEELPFREKPLRAALRARNAGALTIKTRGVAVQPEALRRRLATRGEEPTTLVLTRVAGTGACLRVEPL